MGAPPGGIEAYGVHEHAGTAREMVLDLKYGGQRARARSLAEMLAPAVRAEIPGVTLVTWAPTTPERRWSRGFDQSEIIARHLAALVRLPARATLRRLNQGAQTNATREERLRRPSFVARPRVRGHVLVIDDVVTTGATFAAAGRELLAAGADRVTCVAVTWAPLRATLGSRESGQGPHPGDGIGGILLDEDAVEPEGARR